MQRVKLMEVAIWMKTNWKVLKRLMIMSLSSTMHIVSKIRVPQIGAVQAIYYDAVALKACCEYIEKYHISQPIVYIMACRIGPIARYFYKKNT